MAYLRDEKEKLEIDYPLEKIWAAIPDVVKMLEWKIEEKDDSKHIAKIKTKAGFLSYSTKLIVEAVSVDDKKTQMIINAETPVTTITSMADFGRTRDRVDQFVALLAKQMEKKKKPSTANR
jgi:carbon monoxide dehydrogenase subunit G